MLSFPPAEVWIPRSKRRPCSFRSYKQTCSDRYTWALREGSLSSQYLFLELDAKYSSKVVEDALQCIKMHVAEASGTSHSTLTSSTKEYFLKKIVRLAIGFVLRISKHHNYLSRKFELLARPTSEQLFFEILKPFHSWVLKDSLVTDFCSNDFSEIYLVCLLYQQNPWPEILVKNICKL